MKRKIPYCFELVNRIATERVKPYAPALKIAARIKREPVRTSFDAVYPGMPPALKLSA